MISFPVISTLSAKFNFWFGHQEAKDILLLYKKMFLSELFFTNWHSHDPWKWTPKFACKKYSYLLSLLLLLFLKMKAGIFLHMIFCIGIRSNKNIKIISVVVQCAQLAALASPGASSTDFLSKYETTVQIHKSKQSHDQDLVVARKFNRVT